MAVGLNLCSRMGESIVKDAQSNLDHNTGKRGIAI